MGKGERRKAENGKGIRWKKRRYKGKEWEGIGRERREGYIHQLVDAYTKLSFIYAL